MAAVAVILYTSDGDRLAYTHLLYLPILLAAVAFHVRAGVVAGLLAGLIVGPLMMTELAAGDGQGELWPVRLAMFVLVGGIAGLVQRALAQRLMALEAANARLRYADAQLARREGLHVLGRMVSGIAHDFNNTLTPMLGYAELLNARPEIASDPRQVRAFAEQIITAANDAAAIVQRLRTFYQPADAEQFCTADLSELAEDALRLTEPRWRGEAQRLGLAIAVERDFSAHPELAVLAGELRQALVNLIFNAVDAMPEGGTLTVRTGLGVRGAPTLPMVSYGDVPPSFALVEVSDTGTGMDDETLESCTDLFMSTKGERGTGLGLASVLDTVQRHKGRIEIESAHGAGTTVRLYLPISWTASPLHATISLQPHRSLKIMVVDDEPAVRAFIAAALRGDGHSVVEATTANEALALIEYAPVGMVITDHGMPEILGLDLAQQLKTRWPGLPVILCTGHADHLPDDAPLGYVDGLLAKPIHLSTLRRAVAAALRREDRRLVGPVQPVDSAGD